ncbi:alpha/beta hydrolase [Flavobacterium sp.]|uniref:alpha/beta hydrolase n=1 Tax=Flavobacterium sp. TaxID=239 RepID=UPI0008B2AA79|nr:alpha/beta hydrolase [Flavobacterium sp.]OGS63511.1 MAG: alpha/beta hydrolase [Flavobacteria bacterium GWF1_32_7]
MSKIPVYFMPGLAASPTIFENIKLPEDQFEMHFLEWFLPNDKESIESYALRMTEKITHENPVLVGVSFGGILVQEMAKHIKAQKVIIISSVKSNTEFPSRLKMARATKAYKLLPTQLLSNVELLVKYAFGNNIVAKRLKLYEKYLSVRDKKYLDWAIENTLIWSQKKADENVIHIHGDADEVFPIKHIQNCIVIKGGTHIMIINKFKWLNENLPKLILNEKE